MYLELPALSARADQPIFYGQSPLRETLRAMVIAQKMNDFHADYLQLMYGSESERERDRLFTREVLGELLNGPAAPPAPDGPCQRFIDL